MTEDYNYSREFQSIIDDDEKIIWEGSPRLIPFLSKAIPTLILGVVWLLIVSTMMRPFQGDMFFDGFNGMDSFARSFFSMFTLVKLFPLLLALGQVIYLVFVHKNTHYAITSKRLLFKSGIFGIDYKVIDYDQIKNMEVNVSPVEKMLHVGSIRVFTGEVITTNQTTRSVPTIMSSIENPYEVFKELKKISIDIKTDWSYPNQYRPEENQGYNTKYKQ